MPPHIEVIDIVGSFVDLATVEFTDLIERALGRPATGALLRDLMTLAWRLDAICLAVAAINSEPLLPLGSTIAQFTTSTQIISGPTRRISFDSKRMNTQRCALIVRRPPAQLLDTFTLCSLRKTAQCVALPTHHVRRFGLEISLKKMAVLPPTSWLI